MRRDVNGATTRAAIRLRKGKADEPGTVNAYFAVAWPAQGRIAGPLVRRGCDNPVFDLQRYCPHRT
jgi:hypothetical protein